MFCGCHAPSLPTLDFRLQPRSTRKLRSSGLLRSEWSWFLTNVSEHPIVPVFRGQPLRFKMYYLYKTIRINHIKMDLREVGGGGGDWMELAQDRDRWRALVGTVRNLRVPKMRGISWLAAEPVSFSRGALVHGVSKYSLIYFKLYHRMHACQETQTKTKTNQTRN